MCESFLSSRCAAARVGSVACTWRLVLSGSSFLGAGGKAAVSDRSAWGRWCGAPHHSGRVSATGEDSVGGGGVHLVSRRREMGGMAMISVLAADERAARIVLAATQGPNVADGKARRGGGAVATVELASGAGPVPTVLTSITGELWRRQLAPRLVAKVADSVFADTEQAGVAGRDSWGCGLPDGGERSAGATAVGAAGSGHGSDSGSGAVHRMGCRWRPRSRRIWRVRSVSLCPAGHRAWCGRPSSCPCCMRKHGRRGSGGVDRSYRGGNAELLEGVSDVGRG